VLKKDVVGRVGTHRGWRDGFADAAYLCGAALLTAAVTAWAFRDRLGRLGGALIGAHNDVLYSLGTMSSEWQALRRLDLAALLDAPVMAPLPHGLAFGDNLLALVLIGAPLAWAGAEALGHGGVARASSRAGRSRRRSACHPELIVPRL